MDLTTQLKMTKEEAMKYNQLELQKICQEAGVSPSTCGRCGNYILIETECDEYACPCCYSVMDPSDMPDLWYDEEDAKQRFKKQIVALVNNDQEEE